MGRVVHYVSHGTPLRLDGTQHFQSECRAAIVAGVQDDATLDLCVLNPTGMFFHDADYDEDKTGGTWHWPERVD